RPQHALPRLQGLRAHPGGPGAAGLAHRQRGPDLLGMTPRISVHLTDAAGRTLFARDADRPYYAASTMKLAVLIAASTAVADGRLSLADELPARRTFTGSGGTPFALEGDHLDPLLPAEGTPMTLAKMLEATITRS